VRSVLSLIKDFFPQNTTDKSQPGVEKLEI
jgi:hypothetical protein